MRKLLALVLVGGGTLLGCGDASQNTAGYYRKGPGGEDLPAAPAGSAPAASASATGTASGTAAAPPAGPSSTKLEMNVDNAAPNAELMAETKIVVNVAPKEGFTGKVDLTVTGAPAGVTATFDKTSIELTSASASAMLTLKTSSSVTPGAIALTVMAKSAAGDTKTTSINLTVAPTLTLTIPPNAGALTGMTANTAFAPTPVNLTLGGKKVAIKIKNGDSMGHIIHSGNTGGFNHGNRNAMIAPGAFEGPVDGGQPREVNAAGTYSFYLHDKAPANANGSIVAK